MKPKLPNHFGKNALIVLALVGAGFFAAWLRFRNYLGTESAFTDGVHEYDPKDSSSVRYAVWDSPERLPGAINTPAAESRAALSPDGKLMVFAVGERGLNCELYVADLVDGAPVDPRPLAQFDTAADECSPAFSGDAFYFASDRAGGLGGLDIYRASYSNGEFGAAERMNDDVNSASDDCDPAPRPGSTELAFASNRRDGNFDLFLYDPDAKDGASRIARLEALDTALDERECAFTADGRTLFFASNRGSGDANFDLYRASCRDGEWSSPIALEGLNTAQSERAPLPAFDDFSLYFSRDSGGGNFDLWRARSLELFRMPGRPVGWVELLVLASILLLALLVWLAKRWPKLELVYKCYLVSLIVHLVVFYFARGWFSDTGGRDRLGEGGAHGEVAHFTLDLRSSIRAGLARGGGGSGGSGGTFERSGLASSDAPSKDFSAPIDAADGGEIGATPVAFEAPASAAPSAPERRSIADESPAALGVESSTARTISVAAGPTVERMHGAAPGLAIEAPAIASGRPSSLASSIGVPERRAEVGPGETRESPRGGSSVAAPSAPQAFAPQRGDSGLDPAIPSSATSAASGVALAAPKSDAPKLSGGETIGLELDGLGRVDAARSSASSGGGPERAKRSLGEGSSDAPSRASSDSIAALAPRAPSNELAGDGSSTGGERASFNGLPGAASSAKVGLRDGEAREKIVDASSTKPGATGSGDSSHDLVDSIGAVSSTRERSNELAPAKKSFGGEREAKESAPAPLALAVPDDRPKQEPIAPSKSLENTPYRNRSGEEKTHALALNGGTRETEAAVAKGLAYLARIQRPNGEWGDFSVVDDKYGQVAVGKTALALLALLGAGHTHVSKTEYSDNAARALAFLLAVQDEKSGHFGESDAYNHGIATYAIAECYALTGEAQLRAPLERAVAHILEKQNHSRDKKLFGGWSYYYKDDRTFDRWPRTSITVWQMMALESARLAGLSVPEKAFDDAATFVQNAEDPAQGWFRYNHDPSRLNSSWPTLPASTPAALFALSLAGRDITGDDFARAREFVLSRTPTEYRKGSDDEFVQRGQGNLYFWYYGTLAMFRAGGDAWKRWNSGMKDTLVRGQRKDGSWSPIDVYCGYARDDERDKSYSTAMCVLSLEVYYRYYLPLLKVR